MLPMSGGLRAGEEAALPGVACGAGLQAPSQDTADAAGCQVMTTVYAGTKFGCSCQWRLVTPSALPARAVCVRVCMQINQVLPIGGPGKAYTAREQADILFRLTGRPQNLFPVPVALMDGIIGILDFLAKFFPAQLEVRR